MFFVGLPNVNRLRRWRDFQDVYQKGIRRSGRYLTLRGLRQRDCAGNPQNRGRSTPIAGIAPPTRIGISISQKVSKKAVVRNRIKRQIRAAFRQILPQVAPGWRLVVVVRPGAQECEYGQFLRELKQLLTEAEVLDGH